MIYQCSSCRELVDAATALLDDKAANSGLRCTRCEAVTWLPVLPSSGGAQQPPNIERETPGVEPQVKCSQDVIEAPSKLQRNEMDAELRRNLEAVSVPPGLTALHHELLGLTSRWDHLEAHRTLLQHARAVEGLPWLAGCYRSVLVVQPDDPVALRMQQDIVAIALASLPETRPQTDPGLSSATKAVVYGMLLLGAAALVGRTVYQALRYL